MWWRLYAECRGGQNAASLCDETLPLDGRQHAWILDLSIPTVSLAILLTDFVVEDEHSSGSTGLPCVLEERNASSTALPRYFKAFLPAQHDPQ